MNEVKSLIESNPWIEKEIFEVEKIFICNDISEWKKYDILLSTDKNDHFIQYNTLSRILEIMPQNLNWDGKFVLGLNLSKDDWRSQLKSFVQNKKGTVCFLNFEKHKLNKSEEEYYLEQENNKKIVVENLLKNSNLKIENKQTKYTVSTSPDPTKTLIVGCPPNKCDVLITRSEFVDAIPESCLQKYVNENGVIVHFGRLRNKKQTLYSATFIDATVLPKLQTHNTWTRDFHDYINTYLVV
jgi:hypothetical protein